MSTHKSKVLMDTAFLCSVALIQGPEGLNKFRQHCCINSYCKRIAASATTISGGLKNWR